MNKDCVVRLKIAPDDGIVHDYLVNIHKVHRGYEIKKIITSYLSNKDIATPPSIWTDKHEKASTAEKIITKASTVNVTGKEPITRSAEWDNFFNYREGKLMEQTIVGIDIGHGSVKIVSNGLLSVDEVGCMVSFPTVITPARETHFSITRKSTIPIELGQYKYWVGEDARESTNFLNTKYEKWFLDDIYLAFYKKALSYVAPGPIHVVTGLPVSDYDKWHDELKKQLTGTFNVNGNVYNVLSVRVMPQPFGSFSNYIYDANGHLMNEEALEESVGIIDIGNRTTDFILVESGKWVAKGASGAITIGVSHLLQNIADHVSETYEVDLSTIKVQKALRDRQIKVHGKTTDIGKILDKEVDFFVQFIENTSRVYWGSGGHIDKVLLVGEGAEIFSNYLDKIFPNIAVPNDPGFSNAKGFWKYGMSKTI